LAKPLLAVLAPVGAVFTVSDVFWRWSPTATYLVALFFVVIAFYAGAVLFTRSVEPHDSHLLVVLEKRLGRPLATLRRIARRFLPELGAQPSAAESIGPGD
jgi:hypothetical protein